jgi:NTP pyrophosphatase (non-canonical NTP hydrolase)
MDIEEMSTRAMQIRRRFEQFEARSYGQTWSSDDLVLGFVKDVGDLAAAVQQVEGRRPSGAADPHDALRHEIADCIWALLVIANRFDVDPVAAFSETMDELDKWLDRQTPSE